MQPTDIQRRLAFIREAEKSYGQKDTDADPLFSEIRALIDKDTIGKVSASKPVKTVRSPVCASKI